LQQEEDLSIIKEQTGRGKRLILKSVRQESQRGARQDFKDVNPSIL